MSQHTIDDGVTTYTLPYPQSYKEVGLIRAAEFTGYMGIISRDFHEDREDYPRTIFLAWEDISASDMDDINEVWQLMADSIDTSWTYTDPTGTAYTAWLNPESPNLPSTRYAGAGGTVLHTARMSLLIE